MFYRYVCKKCGRIVKKEPCEKSNSLGTWNCCGGKTKVIREKSDTAFLKVGVK